MRLTGKRKFGAFISISLLTAGSGFAADTMDKPKKGYEVYTLGEIVVKSEKSGVRKIANYTEVTPEDFEATNSFSVPEALMYTPGVVVTTGTKNQAGISIHGFDQKRILTLIDGVPYYETKYGFLDLNQISLDSVARIDVVKGAASALYGANALGGVINVITKKPTETPSFSVMAEYGVDGVKDPYKFALSHGMKTGSFSYFLSYSHRQWDAWEMSEDFEPRLGRMRTFPDGAPPEPWVDTLIEDGGDRNNSDLETNNLWGKFGFEFSENTEVFANLHYVKTEKGNPPNIDSIMVFEEDYFSRLFRWDNYEDWGIDLSARHQFNDQFNLKTSLFYHNHEDDLASYSDVTYDTRIGLSPYEDYILGGLASAEYIPAEWDTIRMGFNFRKDNHEQRADKSLKAAASHSYTGSASFENEMSLLEERLSVVIGASYDWFNVTQAEYDDDNDSVILRYSAPSAKKEFNPMIGASFEINEMFRTFASIARKTRFPTLSEIFTGEDSITGNPSPNLGLEAETSINYTIGLEMEYNDFLNISFMPFFYDISEYIVRNDFDNPNSQYQNYSDVNLLGAEFNIILTPIEDLMIKLAYTYNHAENRSDKKGSKHMEKIVRDKIDVGVQYTVPQFETRLNLTTAYTGDSYDQLPTWDDPTDETIENEAFSLFNAKITQPFMKHFEAYISIDNIFDKSYEPEVAFPTQGRTIWVGASYRL